jgi:hypothetical protein
MPPNNALHLTRHAQRNAPSQVSANAVFCDQSLLAAADGGRAKACVTD